MDEVQRPLVPPPICAYNGIDWRGFLPHTRHRHLEDLLEKRVKSQPVVVLSGARQVGKSFLVRELLHKRLRDLHYVTLDNAQSVDFARRNPSSFLRQPHQGGLFAIDEAQKAPVLFDSIKEIVDKDRRPNQFLLLGSTEFSHRTNVRESLTGRATYLRLFPFTLSESRGLPPKSNLLSPTPRVERTDTLRYLKRGGMPGIFAIRDEGTRLELIEDLIQTTVERDLPLIAGRSQVDPAAVRRILRLIANLDETSDSAIALAARMSTRAVQKYLHLLQMLFFVIEVPPCAGSTGRSQFYLGDVAIAAALGASFRSCLRTWALLEIMSHIEQTGSRLLSEVATYRGPKGGRLDFIVTIGGKKVAILVLDEERVLQQDVEIARSYAERNPDTQQAIALAPVTHAVTMNGVRVLPLECLA